MVLCVVQMYWYTACRNLRTLGNFVNYKVLFDGALKFCMILVFSGSILFPLSRICVPEMTLPFKRMDIFEGLLWRCVCEVFPIPFQYVYNVVMCLNIINRKCKMLYLNLVLVGILYRLDLFILEGFGSLQ